MAERSLLSDLSASLAVFFAWLLLNGLLPSIAPVAGIVVIAGAGAAFAGHYVIRTTAAGQAERVDRSMVGRLGAHWPWALLVALAVAVVLVAFVAFYLRLVPQTGELSEVLVAYLKLPYSTFTLACSAVVVGPLIEEVIFRGWVQGRMTRAAGAEIAIVNTAALFAVTHLNLWSVPYLFLLGLASGYTVYLTGSVWSGVLINAAFNTSLFLVDLFFPDTDQFSALTSGAAGSAATVGIMIAAAAVAVLAWWRMRLIRERRADVPAADPEGRAPPPAALD